MTLRPAFLLTRRLILVLTAASAAVSCSQPETEMLRPMPALRELVTLTAIAGSAGNPIVDVVGIDSCRLIVADQRGAITLVETQGALVELAVIPGGRSIHFEAVRKDRFLAWASSPPWLARVSLNPFALDSFKAPRHKWGGVFLGPAVEFRGTIAMAPLANPDNSHIGRSESGDARLVDLLGPGGSTSFGGPSLPATGDYTSWRTWRGELGQTNDTLLFAAFADGTVHRMTLSSGDSLPAMALPVYFRSVEARTEVLRFPWIQFGNFPFFMDTPQIVTATFGPNGTLYAIRPYGYRWSPRPNQFVRKAGTWIPTRQGLEIYSTNGTSFGAYAVPPDVRGIQADAYGRLFLLAGNDVLVMRDPSAPNTACTYPSRVPAVIED